MKASLSIFPSMCKNSLSSPRVQRFLLFLCQYHTVLITIPLQYSLRLGNMIPLVLLFSLKIVLAIWGLSPQMYPLRGCEVVYYYCITVHFFIFACVSAYIFTIDTSSCRVYSFIFMSFPLFSLVTVSVFKSILFGINIAIPVCFCLVFVASY